jgi:hypothetical protein
MGLIGSYLGALYCGGSGVYMSPMSFIRHPPLWLKLISKHRGTHMQVNKNCVQVHSERKANLIDRLIFKACQCTHAY